MKSPILLVLVLLGCPILETARCDQTNTVQSLGVRVFPAITNGIAFIDGEYIPPPYIIQRDENAVTLNGRRYFIDDRWPLRPKPPPPYKPPLQIIGTISAALAKAKTETEFRAALAGKFTDTDWHDGFATWDKFLSSTWERRNNPGGWRLRPSSPPVVSTNTPPFDPNPAYTW